MKLNFINTSQADDLSISGSVITQNGVETDLSTLVVFEQNEEGTLIPPNISKDDEGMINILIHIDDDRGFLSIGGKFKDSEGVQRTYHNYLIFHDTDLNGDISIEELSDLIDCYNLSKEDRDAAHKLTWDTFTGTEGTLLSQLSDEKRIEWLSRGITK